MKNAKFNSNVNKKIPSTQKNTNTTKKQNLNNINTKENVQIIKKPTNKVTNNNNNNIKKVMNIKQKSTGKDLKTQIKNKKIESINSENNKINKTENKVKKIISYDLKLSKEELNKIINKIFPNTSKLSKSQSNDNIYKYNNEKVSLKNLLDKQKDLYNIINIINSEKNYMKECSLNNLSEIDNIYKNIQNEKIKSLNNKENNYRNKIDVIQQQINDINNKYSFQIKERADTDEQNKKNKAYKEYLSIFKKLRLQNKKINENIKNAEINFEKRLNNLLLLEKNKREEEKVKLIKSQHSLEQKRLETINLEAKKNVKYINSHNERGSSKNYLYHQIEESFKEKGKEKEYIKNNKKNKSLNENNKDKEKERKEYLNKKKKEMEEKMNKLHKMWKERNNKLPKYRSPLYEKALLSEEDCKKYKEEKLEGKKLLYINKEKYIKEKIKLPAINILLKKENSHKNKLINKNRKKENQINNITTFRTNFTNENNNFNSNFNISLINNQNQIGKNISINISLKKRAKKVLRAPNDFNYLEEIKKERLLKSNSDNYLFRKNKANNGDINIEKEKQNIELIEQKYNMDKKLLRIRGGYINNLDLGNKINRLLVKAIGNKINIIENISENN